MGSRSWNPALACRRKYVLSHRPADSEDYGQSATVLRGNAEDVYRVVASEGNRRVALLGGPTVNHQFLAAGLVDEIYLTVEPVLLGTGLSLSSDALDNRLRLIETIRLNQDGTLVLHYVRQNVPSEKQEQRWRQILQNALFCARWKEIEQSEQTRRFCRHDLIHLLDTARIMYLMVLEEGLPFSKDLVYGTGLLHDIGRGLERDGLSHAQAALPVVKAILEQSAYTENEIASILQAIADHSGSGLKLEGHPKTLAALLYQADKAGRRCFYCAARNECYWPETMKNQDLAY